MGLLKTFTVSLSSLFAHTMYCNLTRHRKLCLRGPRVEIILRRSFADPPRLFKRSGVPYTFKSADLGYIRRPSCIRIPAAFPKKKKRGTQFLFSSTQTTRPIHLIDLQDTRPIHLIDLHLISQILATNTYGDPKHGFLKSVSVQEELLYLSFVLSGV